MDLFEVCSNGGPGSKLTLPGSGAGGEAVLKNKINLKSSSRRTARPRRLKFGMYHELTLLYQVCSNSGLVFKIALP